MHTVELREESQKEQRVDQIFERLEKLVKAWVDSAVDSAAPRSSTSARSSYGDPDLDAAMAELDDYLDTSKTESEKREAEARAKAERDRKANEERARRNQQYSGAQYSSESTTAVIEQAYRYLGLQPYAAFAEVKTAYKKLLFKYHPDRNASDPASLKKATETSTKINSAYQIIEAYEESKMAR
jgi:DnaJ-domain-containing protein 1